MIPHLALWQASSGLDPAANAAALDQAMTDAARRGAQMLSTPEMTGMLDRQPDRLRAKVRREEEDAVIATARRAAAREKIWLHLGSLALRGADDRLVNRSLLIAPDGSILARYDKMHLFDVDLPGGETWRESALYAPGHQAVLIHDTPFGTIGLTICYDLRFPALWAALAQGGADLILCPAAFTVPTGRAHWHLLLRARAVEAGLFVAAAAQTGQHADDRTTFGHSLLVDPWGDILLDLGEAPGLGTAALDPARLADVRARLPALAHRRPIPPPLEVRAPPA